MNALAKVRGLAALRQELTWLERNTVGVDGERAAARESWMNVHGSLTELALLLAIDAEADVASAMEAVDKAYRAAPAGLARGQVLELLTDRLGAGAAERALAGVPDDLGELTLGELETRLHGVLL